MRRQCRCHEGQFANQFYGRAQFDGQCGRWSELSWMPALSSVNELCSYTCINRIIKMSEAHKRSLTSVLKSHVEYRKWGQKQNKLLSAPTLSVWRQKCFGIINGLMSMPMKHIVAEKAKNCLITKNSLKYHERRPCRKNRNIAVRIS